MAKTQPPKPGSAKDLISSNSARAATLARLAKARGQMTTATVAAMERKLPWYSDLDAENRSWITLIVQSGIDGFVTWFSDEKDTKPKAIFNVAPSSLARRISLEQTVELLKTSIDTVGEQIQVLLPESDRMALQQAIVYYSREVAFAAAEVYAKAAEMRGAWDDRLEALVIDAVIRFESDDSLISRASALGWRNDESACVVIGTAPSNDRAIDKLREQANKAGFNVMASKQAGRLVCLFSSLGSDAPETICKRIDKLAIHFGSGSIVIGPIVSELMQASDSARAAISGFRAAKAWAEAPRTLLSADLLPERLLSGDDAAKRYLIDRIYLPLRNTGGDLLKTCSAFLANGQSIEKTARTLFVHANTVRYRCRRIQEVTGYSPTHPREGYYLHLALTLGLLEETEA